MSNPARDALLSIEEYCALPDDDGRRDELQAGVVVAEPRPGFRHGEVAGKVFAILHDHVERHGLGGVVVVDCGFRLSSSPPTLRGPDVAFVSAERVATVDDPTRAFPGPPDLAVEVVSPSNDAAEIRAKVAEYLAAGTRLVWVVDPADATVTTYTKLLEPRSLWGADPVDGGDVLPALAVTADAFF